jgi:outer membrane scaffolding protein for murein synthesis (MipA/OmpV family)
MFRIMRSIATLCLGMAALAAAGTASAGDWIVTVGGRAQAFVPYEGAGHDVFLPIPSLQLRRPDRPDRLNLPDDGWGVAAISTGAFSLGPVVRLRGKRRSEDDHVGLHEIPLAIEPGLFATVWPVDWLRGHVEVRKGVRGHSGWIGDAAADLVAAKGPWTASLGPRAGWGDHHYMDEYFGVTPAEAAANPIITTTYQPKGGMRYAGLEATVLRRWGKNWQTTANFGYHRLAGIPADSPIVRDVTMRDEFSGGIGLRYSFGWSH